jgi:hypothetical protein
MLEGAAQLGLSGPRCYHLWLLASLASEVIVLMVVGVGSSLGEHALGGGGWTQCCVRI